MNRDMSISDAWLAERGGLNDARVTSVTISRDLVTIALDDEWANERDGPDYPGKSPVVISISGAVAITAFDMTVMKEKVYELSFSHTNPDIELRVVAYGQHSIICSGSEIRIAGREASAGAN